MRSLEYNYYKTTPKARKINPFFRECFSLMMKAKCFAKPNSNILNIFSSNDLSSARESFIRNNVFADCNYHSIDFWQDEFVSLDCSKIRSYHYQTFHEENSFDVIYTTKILMEHVSDPRSLFMEFRKILKPNGRIYLIAPLIRRQHQAPFDYFRFTEYSLQMLFREYDFEILDITNSGGFMAVVGYYFYFFQRGLGLPLLLERLLDFVHYYVIEPLFYFLDSLDNGYGRDMTLYFLVEAELKKEPSNVK